MSSWHPTGRNGLQFIAEEFWPGGGENGDGRDLYGVAEHHKAWREETMDANLIAEALHPSDADYYDRHRVDEMDDEAFEKWLDEDDADEEDNNYLDVQWLAELRAANDGPYDDLPDGDDGPDTLELARTRRQDGIELANSEFEGLVSSCTSEASRNLARFERDGVRKESLSAVRAKEFGSKDRRRSEWPNIGPHWSFDTTTLCYAPNKRWNGRPRYDSWKRHREAQYRPRHVSPRITDPAYRDAA